MSHYWILLTFSCLGTARLQYVRSSEDANLIGAYDTHYPLPIPYVLNQPRVDYDTKAIDTLNRFSFKDIYESDDAPRLRRTTIENDEDLRKTWQPNLVDTDKTVYLANNEVKSPFIEQERNDTSDDNIDIIPYPQKRSFSPWGGKRDGTQAEQMWSWKRSVKEPSMPKRVRFSPWGGKRSGQVIYKPGYKASRIIFSSSVPELTKIISNYSPRGSSDSFNMAGFQMLPLLDKRFPIKLVALSKNVEGRLLRDILPFKDYAEPTPNFKAGHPYTEVNMKKDGKRKVKFNAWGGKRSTPVIGPIWTPNYADNESPIEDIVKENMEFKQSHGYGDKKNI